MINNCNSATLDMGRGHRGKHFLDHNKTSNASNPENFNYQQDLIQKK